MKAKEIFEECYGRYRGLREWLAGASGAVRSLELGKPSAGYLWRPDRARACEYVADFERIGRGALRRREWKKRLLLFEVCFVNDVAYRRAVRLVGVSEGTFDYWYSEVKRALGDEFARKNLFPPNHYFLRRNEVPLLSAQDITPERERRRKRPAAAQRQQAAEQTAGAVALQQGEGNGASEFVSPGRVSL